MYAVLQNKENNFKKKYTKYLAFYFAKILVQFSYNNTFRSILIRNILHKYNTLTYVCVLTEFIYVHTFYARPNVNTIDLRSFRFKLYTTKVHNAIQWGLFSFIKIEIKFEYLRMNYISTWTILHWFTKTHTYQKLVGINVNY